MKKHSQTDLVSRLKTRKILGVGGEDDDGEVHRSKVSFCIFVLSPKLHVTCIPTYTRWHTFMFCIQDHIVSGCIFMQVNLDI